MTLSAYNVGKFAETFEACARECPGLTIDDVHMNVAQFSSHYYGNSGSNGMRPDAAAPTRTLAVSGTTAREYVPQLS